MLQNDLAIIIKLTIKLLKRTKLLFDSTRTGNILPKLEVNGRRTTTKAKKKTF